MSIKYFNSKAEWDEYIRGGISTNTLYIYYDRYCYNIVVKTDKLTSGVDIIKFIAFDSNVDLSNDPVDFRELNWTKAKIHEELNKLIARITLLNLSSGRKNAEQ